MSLDHYHYHDGRPVSFDREKVIHIEPHESGSGMFVRLGFEGGTAVMHLREDYDFLVDRITDGTMERTARYMAEEDSEVFDKKAFWADLGKFGDDATERLPEGEVAF